MEVGRLGGRCCGFWISGCDGSVSAHLSRLPCMLDTFCITEFAFLMSYTLLVWVDTEQLRGGLQGDWLNTVRQCASADSGGNDCPAIICRKLWTYSRVK